MEFYFKRPIAALSVGLSQLTLDLHAALAEGAPPRRRGRPAAGCEKAGCEKADCKNADCKNADCEKADCATARALRWGLRGDGPIDAELARARVELAGGAARVCAALGRLAARVPTADENLAWQIAALGADAVTAVVDTPSLLEYFVHEIQPVDLPALVRQMQ